MLNVTTSWQLVHATTFFIGHPFALFAYQFGVFDDICEISQAINAILNEDTFVIF